MPDPATGGTLRDAIARALERENQTDEKSTAWHYSDAEAVLVALKEHLAEHPAAIQELGWEDVAHRDGWLIDVGSGHMRENLVPVETVHGAPVYAPPPPAIPGEDAQ